MFLFLFANENQPLRLFSNISKATERRLHWTEFSGCSYPPEWEDYLKMNSSISNQNFPQNTVTFAFWPKCPEVLVMLDNDWVHKKSSLWSLNVGPRHNTKINLHTETSKCNKFISINNIIFQNNSWNNILPKQFKSLAIMNRQKTKLWPFKTYYIYTPVQRMYYKRLSTLHCLKIMATETM